LALNDLKKNGLVEYDADKVNEFGGLSRREMIRKVGLASMVALPAIMSIVAPMAVHAQSVPVACTACVMKSGGAPACPDVCGPTVMGTCYDNSGCGAGAFLFDVSCLECHLTGGQTGQPSTVSWTSP
jgi:hypothetical protein